MELPATGGAQKHAFVQKDNGAVGRRTAQGDVHHCIIFLPRSMLVCRKTMKRCSEDAQRTLGGAQRTLRGRSEDVQRTFTRLL